jgi:hypothetical protein
MTTNETKKVIPEFKPVKKLSPFVVDQFNNRGGKGGGKKTAIAGNVGVRKMNIGSNLKKGGGGDR